MENTMTYTAKLQRIEAIISQINSGAVDPSEMIKLITEAQTLINECSAELTTLEKSLKQE